MIHVHDVSGQEEGVGQRHDSVRRRGHHLSLVTRQIQSHVAAGDLAVELAAGTEPAGDAVVARQDHLGSPDARGRVGLAGHPGGLLPVTAQPRLVLLVQRRPEARRHREPLVLVFGRRDRDAHRVGPASPVVVRCPNPRVDRVRGPDRHGRQALQRRIDGLEVELLATRHPGGRHQAGAWRVGHTNDEEVALHGLRGLPADFERSEVRQGGSHVRPTARPPPAQAQGGRQARAGHRPGSGRRAPWLVDEAGGPLGNS